jgi:hypothetical protein
MLIEKKKEKKEKKEKSQRREKMAGMRVGKAWVGFSICLALPRII